MKARKAPVGRLGFRVESGKASFLSWGQRVQFSSEEKHSKTESKLSQVQGGLMSVLSDASQPMRRRSQKIRLMKGQ